MSSGARGSRLLAGRVAMITGGGRGIGREIALAYAAEGADVALVARTAAELEAVADESRELGVHALPLIADIAVEADARRAVAETLRHYGRIDILVNNAGITPGAAKGPINTVLDVSVEFWERMFAVNCHGAFLITREALPAMVQRESGCIISITSKVANNPLAGNAPYGPSKAALEAFTRVVDTEFAAHGIRANLLHPGGPVATSVFNEHYQPFSGTVAAPDVIRGAAVWLASDGAAHVHGAVIDARVWSAQHAAPLIDATNA